MEKLTNQTVGSRVKQLRLALGKSQEEFAKDINMTAGYISQVENEISQPSDRTVEAICGAYSISPEWLKRGIDMPDLLDIGNRYQ